MHSAYSKTGSDDTPPKPVSSDSYSCSHLSSFSAIRFKYASQAAACCFVRFVSDTISPYEETNTSISQPYIVSTTDAPTIIQPIPSSSQDIQTNPTMAPAIAISTDPIK